MIRVASRTGMLIAVMVLLLAGCSGTPSENQLFEQARVAQEANDPQTAITAYQSIVEHYPTGDRSDEAQFMIGFLYANDLGDTTNARAAYQYFLDTYGETADSGMVISANWELSHLGTGVEQIDEILQFNGEEEEPAGGGE